MDFTKKCKISSKISLEAEGNESKTQVRKNQVAEIVSFEPLIDFRLCERSCKKGSKKPFLLELRIYFMNSVKNTVIESGM